MKIVLALLLSLALVAPAAACITDAECADTNPCTDDHCTGGQCTHGPSGCDDQNPCTDDVCDPNVGCLHATNNLPCSDGNACTSADVCGGGVCVGGAPSAGCAACQAVAVIPPAGGTFVGTTNGTSTIAGSCGSSTTSPERVYAWTPTTSGTATIQTCGNGTNYDSVVYVRGGSCTGPEIGCNDDACDVSGVGRKGSRLTVPVTAGTTYYVTVDGFAGRRGTYALSVSPPSTCGNNVREGAEECDGTAASGCVTGRCSTSCTCVPPATGLPDLVPQVSDVSFQFHTTVDPGDVAEGCAEGTSNVDLMRFTVRSTNVGTANLHIGDPGCPLPCTEHPLAVCTNPEFICSPAQGHNHAHYANYARYELLDASNQAVVVGHKQGFCLSDGSCASGTHSCANQGINVGCSDTYGSGLGCEYLDITGIPAGNYTLRVTLDPFGRIPELNEVNNVAAVPVTIPGTPASVCSAATTIPAAGGTFSGTTSGTGSLGASCGFSTDAPERVFLWTPATSGTATIQTCGAGTSFDTVIYARGGSCTGTELGCNDDACTIGDGTSHGSRITPSVTAGQPVVIVVDGYRGLAGNFSLTVTPPAGSGTLPPPPPPTGGGGSCATPTVIPAAGGSVSGTTSGTSALAGSCGTSGTSPERVFAWTPARSGTATIQTCGSGTSYDSVVYVRGGSCAGPELGCSDDVCDVNGLPHKGSRLSTPVTAGTTYYIVVDGYAGRSGAFTLNVTAP
jgi:hypothetical protein